MNIYEKLQIARVNLQNKKLKKSGNNKFSGFKYFELSDFLPEINNIFNELKLFSNFSIVNEIATLEILNTEKVDERILFTMPTCKLTLKGCSEIQALGGVNTYCRRYLYLNALEIVEFDMLDSNAGNIESKTNNIVDNDIDIIEGLKATDNIKNLNAYFNEYKSKVNNEIDLKKAYIEKAKELQKIKGEKRHSNEV